MTFKLGDQILIMNQGQLVQKGTSRDLIEAPANEFDDLSRSQACP